MRKLEIAFGLPVCGVVQAASAAKTLVFDEPQLAGIGGFRTLWDPPIVLADDGLVVETPHILRWYGTEGGLGTGNEPHDGARSPKCRAHLPCMR